MCCCVCFVTGVWDTLVDCCGRLLCMVGDGDVQGWSDNSYCLQHGEVTVCLMAGMGLVVCCLWTIRWWRVGNQTDGVVNIYICRERSGGMLAMRVTWLGRIGWLSAHADILAPCVKRGGWKEVMSLDRCVE